MFYSMDALVFGLLAVCAAVACLLLGPIAFFKARALKYRLNETDLRLKEAEIRIALQEARLRDLTGTTPTAVQPEASPAPEAEPLAPAEEKIVAPPAAAPPVRKAGPARAEPKPAPAAQTNWEERLGTRWAVIVGGLALAFGLVLMVRFSIEKGLLGPGPRVVVGLLLSALLAAAGEWLRRREAPTSRPEGLAGKVPIPTVLTVAATVGSFGSIYAAHALYDLIPAVPAFGALAVVAIASMLAAVLHGPALAGIGLAASLATPALVQSGNPNPWPVMVYIAVVAGAAYWLARTRRWLWLAIAAAVGGFLWGILLSTLIGSGPRGGEFFAAAAFHALVQLALALYVFAEPYRAHSGLRPSKSAMAVPALLAVAVLVALGAGIHAGQFGLMWLALALLPVGLLAFAGSLVPAAAGLVTVAALLTMAVTRLWPHRPDQVWNGDAIESFMANWLEPTSPLGLLGFAGALALGIFALAADRLRKPPTLAPWAAITYAATATAAPVIVLGLIWLRHPINQPHYEYAAVAGGLGLLFAMATATFRSLGGEDWRTPGRLGSGFFATGALAALALGLTVMLNSGHLTVSLALAALAAAWIAEREGIPALRWAVAALGAVILARLFWDPRVVGANLGTTPIFNWLLIGYGIPALAFAGAAWLLRREPEDLPVQIAQALAIAFSALLGFYEIRHALNGGDPFAPTSTLTEDGLQASLAFVFAIATTLMTTARERRVFSAASLAFGIAAIALSVVMLLVVSNPFLTHSRIEGGRFFNTLILAYALPAVLATALARLSIGRRPEWYRIMAAVAAIGLAFAYVNLQTRRFFQGDALQLRNGFSDVETYTYSALWLGLGLMLLAYGIVRQSREARFGSALLVLAATIKVFIFDVSGLEGALRALSFIGLGFVLIGIGLVYQKLLFRAPPAARAPDNAAP